MQDEEHTPSPPVEIDADATAQPPSAIVHELNEEFGEMKTNKTGVKVGLEHYEPEHEKKKERVFAPFRARAFWRFVRDAETETEHRIICRQVEKRTVLFSELFLDLVFVATLNSVGHGFIAAMLEHHAHYGELVVQFVVALVTVYAMWVNVMTFDECFGGRNDVINRVFVRSFPLQPTLPRMSSDTILRVYIRLSCSHHQFMVSMMSVVRGANQYLDASLLTLPVCFLTR